jgi:hypothetical protein
MSQVEPGTLSTSISRRSMPSPAWPLLLIPLIAALVLAVALGPRQGSIAAANTVGDRVDAPGLVEFRAGERLSAVRAGDSLLAPGIIEFRQGERVTGVVAGDPLLAPAMLEFRQSERVTDAPGG